LKGSDVALSPDPTGQGTMKRTFAYLIIALLLTAAAMAIAGMAA
jgi:hypothetical protein